MKKIILSMMMTFLLITIVPAQLKSETVNQPAASPKGSSESAQANALLSRLYEINAMDKSNLKSPEKRQLRQEVRGIKGHLKELGGGVYLSVGAIIIIILLLILLL